MHINSVPCCRFLTLYFLADSLVQRTMVVTRKMVSSPVSETMTMRHCLARLRLEQGCASVLAGLLEGLVETSAVMVLEDEDEVGSVEEGDSPFSVHRDVDGGAVDSKKGGGVEEVSLLLVEVSVDVGPNTGAVSEETVLLIVGVVVEAKGLVGL